MNNSVKKEKTKEAVQLILSDLLTYDERLEVMERIQDAVLQELEINMWSFLSAYVTMDVDAMVESITGWNLYDIMAKAKIVPDEDHVFYQAGEVPSSDLLFEEVLI